MKIAIVGYNTCCLNNTGGIQVRIRKIYELLLKRNDVEVEYFRPMETDFESVSIFHLFKLEPEYFNLVMKAKSRGKKIVLSSVVPLKDDNKLKFYKLFNKFPILTVYKMQQMILNTVDKVISETHQEAKFIIKHYGLSADKVLVIPNGIEIEDYGGNEIFKHLDIKRDYILQVGLIHENKNQLNTIKALKGTGIDLVIIGGGNNGETRYLEECIKLANGDKHIHFLGWVDNNSNLLKSAYANAKVLVFPSFNETFGLVALEGAIAGCNMAMTKTLPIHDFHTFDDCWLFDPHNVEDMKCKIIEAFQNDLNTKVKERVKLTFSWDKIIDKHLNLYKSI